MRTTAQNGTTNPASDTTSTTASSSTSTSGSTSGSTNGSTGDMADGDSFIPDWEYAQAELMDKVGIFCMRSP